MRTLTYAIMGIILGYFLSGLLPWYITGAMFGICAYNALTNPTKQKKEREIVKQAKKIFADITTLDNPKKAIDK